MKVELSIRDDKELRDHIKDCIRGEIVSIARSEIDKIIAEVFKSKYDQQIGTIFEKAIKEYVAKELRSNYDGSKNITNIAKEEIVKTVKLWAKGQY